MLSVSGYFVLTAVNYNMDVPMIMVLLSYFSRNRAWRTDVRTYRRTEIRTDSHVTTNIFEIDGLPNFLRVWVSARAISGRSRSG